MSTHDPNERTAREQAETPESAEQPEEEQAIGPRNQEAALDPSTGLRADRTEDVSGGMLADATGGLPSARDANRFRKAPLDVGRFPQPGDRGGVAGAPLGDIGGDTDTSDNPEEIQRGAEGAERLLQPSDIESGVGKTGVNVSELREDLGAASVPSSEQGRAHPQSLGPTPGGMGGAGDAATTGGAAGSGGAGIGAYTRAQGATGQEREDRTRQRQQSGAPENPLPEPAETPEAQVLREALTRDDLPGTRRVDITEEITPEAADDEERDH